MVFPVVMYGCESWTVKQAEHQRIDAFELWCWRPPETAAIRTWLRMFTSPLAGPCKKIMPSLGRQMRMCLLPVFREGTLLE